MPDELNLRIENLGRQMDDMSDLLKELSDSIRGAGFGGGGLVNRVKEMEERLSNMHAVQLEHSNQLKSLSIDKARVFGGYWALAAAAAIIVGAITLALKAFGK